MCADYVEEDEEEHEEEEGDNGEEMNANDYMSDDDDDTAESLLQVNQYNKRILRGSKALHKVEPGANPRQVRIKKNKEVHVMFPSFPIFFTSYHVSFTSFSRRITSYYYVFYRVLSTILFNNPFDLLTF